MLERRIPFCIDHLSIAAIHRDHPIDLVTKLGFATTGCYAGHTVHFIFKNSYFELCTYQLNTAIIWLTQSVPATSLSRIHSYHLNVKRVDPSPMYSALVGGGIETIGEINNPFRQHVRYGEEEGETGYQTSFIQNYEPFTNILFGCTTHPAKELIVRNETKFLHINGARRLAYITGYYDSKERSEEADAAISKLYNATRGATDINLNLGTYQLVDRGAYMTEFGCEPRNDGLKLPVMAATLSGYHLEFVKKRAYGLNLNYSHKSGKLYVDCRCTLGLFLVFIP